MKKIISVLFVLLLVVGLTACNANKEVNKEESNATLPNPMVEYDSLAKINELLGVNIVEPAVMGKGNQKYFVISDSIGEYDFDLNGKSWTIRGARIADQDISGIFDEHNEFVTKQDTAVYTQNYYLDRLFDGDIQYTIVVNNPEDMSEELFSDICLELELIMKWHRDDELVGDYMDSYSQRASAVIERVENEYNIYVDWSSSANELTTWSMHATKDGDRLNYKGENITNITFDENGNDSTVETVSNNVGHFDIKDGKLYWTEASEENLQNCIFEKIIYTEEN